MDLTPAQIFYWVYVFNFAAFGWRFWLLYRQYRVHYNTAKRPSHVSDIVSEEDYDKARLYKLDKHRFGFFKMIYDQIQLSFILWFNITAYLWHIAGHLTTNYYGDSEFIQSIVFGLIQRSIDFVTSIPPGYYDTFVVEAKFGFNKQTSSTYLLDCLKKFVLGMNFILTGIPAIVWIFKYGGSYSFAYVWFFISAVVVATLVLYPEIIAPLFNKYVPLPESELIVKIQALADRLSFPMTEIFVVDSSKKSAHSNAYVYGFGTFKRIVLYDTLLSKELNEMLHGPTAVKDKIADGDENNNEKSKSLGLSDDEVVAVMAHEFGHWKYMHFMSYVIVGEFNLLLFLAAFSYFYQNVAIYEAFGFDAQPVVIGLFLAFWYMLPLYFEFLWFSVSCLSRWEEACADRFAAELGYASQLSLALIKLCKNNCNLPVDDWIYSMARHSHPTTPERISSLKKYI